MYANKPEELLNQGQWNGMDATAKSSFQIEEMRDSVAEKVSIARMVLQFHPYMMLANTIFKMISILRMLAAEVSNTSAFAIRSWESFLQNHYSPVGVDCREDREAIRSPPEASYQ